jgi:hypothetical protein
LNVTTALPWWAPKLLPAIVTAVPTGPDNGDTLLMLGKSVTVNEVARLAVPPTVTTTGPVSVLAPLGTVTEMLVSLQLVAIAGVPAKVTVLLP